MRGYFHWSAFDNFEWSEGYRPKFGLIAVDDDFRRVPKPSAYAFAELARARSRTRRSSHAGSQRRAPVVQSPNPRRTQWYVSQDPPPPCWSR